MTPDVYELRAEVDMAAIAMQLDARGGYDGARFYEAVDAAAELLTQFPGLGKRLEGAEPGLRTWLVKNRWHLAYRSTPSGVRITRVTWAAGDPDTWLR